jgi:hypothetical protein
MRNTSALGGTLSNLQKINATQYTAIFTAATNTLINNASVNVTAGSWQEGNYKKTFATKSATSRHMQCSKIH